jgi:hypothetical protein
MPTLYFASFNGIVERAEAVQQGENYVVADGPYAGIYLPFRQGLAGVERAFFLSEPQAELGAATLLRPQIARIEFEIAKLERELTERKDELKKWEKRYKELMHED